METKHFNKPDEVRNLPNTKIEVVNFNNVTIMRATFNSGWKWSKDVKPTANTESCQTPHIQYVISGRLMIVMEDGAKTEIGPGDAVVIPPGHDAWVVGSEPCVVIDFAAGKDYGKKK